MHAPHYLIHVHVITVIIKIQTLLEFLSTIIMIYILLHSILSFVLHQYNASLCCNNSRSKILLKLGEVFLGYKEIYIKEAI